MSIMRRGAWVAAALLMATMAHAQAPADPLAPGAGADGAQPEKAKPAVHEGHKANHHEAGGFSVTVHNERSVGLMQLTVGPAGDPNPKKMVGALAFGRKTVIHVQRTKDCLYDVRGHFADEADTEQLGVDLCKDKNINLTD
jgi:hypothetical protein